MVFIEEIQQNTKLKKDARKRYKQTLEEVDKETYKLCKKEAKKAVAIAKSEAYDRWYSRFQKSVQVVGRTF